MNFNSIPIDAKILKFSHSIKKVIKELSFQCYRTVIYLANACDVTRRIDLVGGD